MKITRKSGLTGAENTREVDLTPEQYANWDAGLYVGFLAEVFPHLGQADRDFLITGATPEEMDDAFGLEKDCE